MEEELLAKDEHGFLSSYPYTKDQGQYVIHKKMQTKLACAEFFDPKSCVKDASRSEIIYRAMFWSGILFAVIAIVVTLVKELDEGRRSEEIILRLSITELILAIVSIVISLSKHVIRHNSLVLLQKNITVEARRDVQKRISGRRKVYYILAAIFAVFLSVIIISFAVMHSKDDETYQYLTYTKFTTTITLFLSIIIDGIISDVLSDMFTVVKLDQCKLVIHQMKEELREHVEEERLKILEEYLKNHQVFSLSESPHIKFQEPSHITATTGTTTTTTTVSRDSSKKVNTLSSTQEFHVRSDQNDASSEML